MKAGFLSGGASHNSCLCPHPSRPPADSTGRIPVTQGGPHPTFLPHVPEGRVRTGLHQAALLQLHSIAEKEAGLPPWESIPLGGRINAGGRGGERSRKKRQDSRLQAGGTASDPSLWFPLINYQEIFRAQSPHLGKEIQFCPLPKTPVRYWDTPGTWDREGSFVFLIVHSERDQNMPGSKGQNNGCYNQSG